MKKNPKIKWLLCGVIAVLAVILCAIIFLVFRALSPARTPVNDTAAGAEIETEIDSSTESDGGIQTAEQSQSAGENQKVDDSAAQTKAETETAAVEENMTESETAAETEIDIEPETEAEAEADPIRIVLDPGHDDICSRNHPDLGFNEQDLNLKIALACREELETYKGVEVFMTREDGSCPDNGEGSDDVTGRTAYADSVGADLFVSLHNNATGLGYPSEANGTEVYVTVYSPFHEESQKLGECILEELTTQVDLAGRGVLTRTKPEKGYYDDGNVKDWYYLISTSVERGFPGIIVEHAFMDNPHDNALLKEDENLKTMGIADATGIARYFGLEKK